MTAMQQGPPGPGPAEDTDRAAALLRHAQRVADELQSRAEEEARQQTGQTHHAKTGAQLLEHLPAGQKRFWYRRAGR